jgi:DNA polymerase-3 subunit delta
MARWIQAEAKSSGGDFSPGGARLLAGLVGADKRHAAREVEKLLAYTNYARPVEEDDVQHVAVSAEEEDSSQIFQLVDALGHQQGQVALNLLHQLLGLREPLSIFGMIVRQFRLLLLSREILDAGGTVEAVREKLDLHPYVAGKVIAQARNFDLPTLEAIYHKLGQFDRSIKTGGISATTALDTLIADLTAARL